MCLSGSGECVGWGGWVSMRVGQCIYVSGLGVCVCVGVCVCAWVCGSVCV